MSDFVTTLMHEVIHGMGFLGTADVAGDLGKWGEDSPTIPPERRLVAHGRFSCSLQILGAVSFAAGAYPQVWDQFVVNGSGQSILDTSLFANPSPELKAQLTSANLFWNGDAGKAANGGAPLKLFAPTTWAPASSYSHLDDATYDGGPDAMLTSAGENMATIDLGPRVLGMLGDMGWTLK